ncbi:TM2 domain-containing protein almondex [Gryllus bimaculatus]|nr:TM2 domain-containing protein almondex [Gryllus bimaculatus]
MKFLSARVQIPCFVFFVLFLWGVNLVLSDRLTGSSQPGPIDYALKDCPTGVECSKLGGACLNCSFNKTCVYGSKINVTCRPKQHVNCTTDGVYSEKALQNSFERELICRYCYQTEHWEHTCVYKANCNSVASPRVFYKQDKESLRKTNCSVKSEILCLGNRTFEKKLPCNWTGGYRWTTALALSITLGGFGADRFYLGHWQEGIGKLFSFGGLGVWTLIDVILIALHYLGPADGSLYI